MSKPSCDSNPKHSRCAVEAQEICAPEQRAKSQRAKLRRQRVAMAALGALALTGGITAGLDATAKSSEVNPGQLALTLTGHDGLKLGTGDGDDQGFSSPWEPSRDDRNNTSNDNNNNIPNEMQLYNITGDTDFPVGTYNGEVAPTVNANNGMSDSSASETYTNPFSNNDNNNNSNNNNDYEMNNLTFQVPEGWTTDPPNSPLIASVFGIEGKDAYGNDAGTTIYPDNADEIDLNLPPMGDFNSSITYGNRTIDNPYYDNSGNDNSTGLPAVSAGPAVAPNGNSNNNNNDTNSDTASDSDSGSW
ncbi:hypothetical protein LAUMK191_01142 [Mycobacterium attenuatum]|uniref:Uncharacterized protein n=1 Tax=Mycobacterium attenuatum TaxID=2341086 RepID=A0A498PUF9_9MYCO|nr:hypothetical protein [Mycobacterium attenuatum]VBA35779.1 hypothetical protein LAUMK136_01142 [Mycobacterium attenuatum]VBA48334.1 hypothetical protein LAUMK191_01142 [Mycobacterium attenuatum]